MGIAERLLLEERRAAAAAWLARTGEPCRIKLCGMFRDDDIVALNKALPELGGFIFGFPPSHRNVSSEQAKRLMAQVDERIYRVVVTVNQPWQRAAHYLLQLPADLIQLHGNESNDDICGLRSRLHIGIIQAFRVRSSADIERALASAADMVLLDAGQGSGTRFDWELVDDFAARRPFILAGGLAPDNVAEAVRTLHPWGVDISSGIETGNVKDPRKMEAAVAALRGIHERGALGQGYETS